MNPIIIIEAHREGRIWIWYWAVKINGGIIAEGEESSKEEATGKAYTTIEEQEKLVEE